VSTCKTRRNKTRTPLPQTDRATRRRSKSGRNKLYNESRTNRSDAQLQGYSRQTCNKLYAPGHEASTITGVIHKLDRRRILTTPPTCRGEIILVQSSGDISTQKRVKLYLNSRCGNIAKNLSGICYFLPHPAHIFGYKPTGTLLTPVTSSSTELPLSPAITPQIFHFRAKKSSR